MLNIVNRIYKDIAKLFTKRADDFDYEYCTRALTDCYDLLAVWGDDIDERYELKIRAEIELLRNRQMKILKGEVNGN